MDRESNLWKLPISELSLMIANKEDKNDNKASREFIRRSKDLVYEILCHDQYVINMRGHRIDNYLIGKKPSLQQLFETYFNYVADYNPYNGNYSRLLFSEIPLCNQMFFYNSFFYRIYNNEINNIGKRIGGQNTNEEGKELLSKYKQLLTSHKEIILSRMSDSKNNIMKYKYSETYRILSEKALGHNFFTNRYFNNYTPSIDSTFNPIEMLYNKMIPLGIMVGDSIRLIGQKSILLEQSKRGIGIDYSSEVMQKILKNNFQ